MKIPRGPPIPDSMNPELSSSQIRCAQITYLWTPASVLNPELNPELCISLICSAQVLTTTEFPVDSIVVGLFRQLLIPNSIPQYCKSLPRNSTWVLTQGQGPWV